MRRHGQEWRHARLAATVTAMLAAACIDLPTMPPLEPPLRADPAWVIGEALAAVDPVTGLFRLTPPPPLVMSESDASELAVSVAGLLSGPAALDGLVAQLQQQRGALIDPIALQLCNRPTYSQSPFGVIPPALPGWARRSIGSHWAIPFCGGDGAAQISIGIPDNPADLRVVDGRLVFRQFGGGADFDLTGVPRRFPTGLPLTPEEAVRAVFERTGLRVRSVPAAFNQLENGITGSYPLCASWRMQLERPLTVHRLASGAVATIDELYVRHVPACYSDSTAFYVPAPTQPTSVWLQFPKDTTGSSADAGRDSVEVPLVRPTRFDRVAP